MSNPDFRKMSDSDLEQIIVDHPGGSPYSTSAFYELQKRHLEKAVNQISKRHWTLTPAFWVAVAAMVFAAIAAWPVVRDWFLFSASRYAY